jgi:hypothetical protein
MLGICLNAAKPWIISPSVQANRLISATKEGGADFNSTLRPQIVIFSASC